MMISPMENYTKLVKPYHDPHMRAGLDNDLVVVAFWTTFQEEYLASFSFSKRNALDLARLLTMYGESPDND